MGTDLPILRRLKTSGRVNSYLVLTYLLLVLFGVGGLIVVVGYSLQWAIVEQAKRELSLRGMMLAQAAHEFREHRVRFTDSSFRSWLRTSAHDLSARIVVIDPSTGSAVSSDERPAADALPNPAVLTDAREGRIGVDIHWDQQFLERRLTAIVPFFGGGVQKVVLQGIVRVSVSMTPVQTEIRSTWVRLLGAGAAILMITIMVSLRLARWISTPLQALTLATEAVASGDLNQTVPSVGPEEVRRLAQSFNRMAERVKQLLDRQRAFTANAAHELRSPLTGLRLRLEVLQRHAQQEPHLIQTYLPQMDKEIAYLQRLVEHLLTLAGLDEGQTFPRIPIDLAPLCYEVAEAAELLAREASLLIKVEVPSHLPPVAANAEAMRMVVRNLLDNAIRNTPAGGVVTFQAQGDERTVTLAVADTGQGIAAEHLPRIFDRFYRVESGKTRSGRGAGLGLTLVKSLVETFGGQISVESQVGRGTRFTIALPLIVPEPQHSQSESHPGSSGGLLQLPLTAGGELLAHD
ncbi:MAG: HAMP domain-containing histidine kinase [Candidatus Methylomirabilis oxygeniifera]|uniref:histidine kinase n=1 Tax=Methylomirabilis oxygeniifera TaxID=671143 RepID=D5ML48_METO1|nr:MAG: HAMP domain-containing histidine kinase [Candidatus Methylomirabilis oxyfera]CBE69890.1 putative Histidine kinase [Candidatus Methylomirabilis oxyfera]